MKNLIVNFQLFTSLLSKQQRRSFFLILAFVAFAGVLEVLTVFSVMPFLKIVTAPENVESHPQLSVAYDLSGAATVKQFLVMTAVLVVILFVAASAVRALITWIQVRFAWSVNQYLTMRLLNGYFYKPFMFFSSRNTADLQRFANAEVRFLTQTSFVPMIQLVQQSFVFVLIIGLLIIVKPLVALFAFGIVAIVYGVLIFAFRRSIASRAQQNSQLHHQRFRLVGEAFGGIKLTKLHGLERFFLKEFSENNRQFADNEAVLLTISQLPRYFFEAFAFSVVILAIAIVTAISDGASEGLDQLVPTMALFLFATYRLIPNAQILYGNLNRIRFAFPRLQAFLREYQAVVDGDQQAPAHNIDSTRREELRERLCSHSPMIRVSDLSFTYGRTDQLVLQDINLDIPRGERLGFRGTTGSGKTTLIDLIVGLLEPSGGEIQISGEELDDKSRSTWQSLVGYVGQETYLTDSTLAENIALGIPVEEIKLDKVAQAARLAAIDDFIDELPDGYWTKTGERGCQLSGGQRQRIGIARALYREPELLVLDEATSNLDERTEQQIVTSLKGLNKSMTVLTIAHRQSVLDTCDVVATLEGGELTLTPSKKAEVAV